MQRNSSLQALLAIATGAAMGSLPPEREERERRPEPRNDDPVRFLEPPVCHSNYDVAAAAQYRADRKARKACRDFARSCVL